MQDQMQNFINFDEPEEQDIAPEVDDLPFNRNCQEKLMNLNYQRIQIVKNDNIVYIGDLVLRTEPEMLGLQILKKSLNERKRSFKSNGS